MFQRIELTNWKHDGRRIVDLDGPMLLVGPNGSGKSGVVEAIVYALDGSVPTGRSNDEIRKWFGPTGGVVRLVDDGGHWLERGVEYDAKAKKASEFVRTSDDEEDAEAPNLARWSCVTESLRLRDFLALSADRRRQFVLGLVGVGSGVTRDAILDELAVEYAREVAGPAASAATVADPSALPKAERRLVEYWSASRGVRDVLEAEWRDDASTSRDVQRLAKAANREKNAARRLAKESEEAANELERGLQGAAAAASTVESIRADLLHAKAKRDEAADLRCALADTVPAIAGASDRLAEAERRLAARKVDLESCDPIGEPPEMRSPDAALAGIRELETKLRDRQAALSAVADRVHAARVAKTVAKAANDRFEAASRELRHWKSGNMSRLARAIDAVDDAHGPSPQCKELSEAFAVIAASHVAHGNRLSEQVDKLGSELVELAANASSLDAESAGSQAEADRLVVECKQIGDAIHLAREELSRAAAEDERARAAHERKVAARANAEAECARAEADVDARQRDLAAANAQRKKLEAKPAGDIEALAAQVETLERELVQAAEAAGAVEAYNQAMRTAERSRVAVRAWTAAERAAKRYREQFVARLGRDFVNDVAEFLADADVEARPYLELENARGTPTFDVGWIAGGERRSISSLSGGEAVLIGAALTIAICRRVAGRRVVLVEADALDEPNLGRLLRGLSRNLDGLDACVVATHTAAAEGPAESSFDVVDFTPAAAGAEA